MRRTSCGALVWAVLLVPLCAGPAAGADLELNQEARQLVERLVVERATTLATVQRRASAEEERMLAQLAQRDASLRQERSARRRVQLQLSQLQRDRASLIARIAERDRAFRVELASYRLQVGSIAASPDERKRAALRAFADGDRAGGFEALLDLQRAETIALAAGWRELGALGLERYDRGETSAASVAAMFREAQRVDPSDFDGWVQLARLEAASGALEAALEATRRATAAAIDPWQRAVAAAETAQVQARRGDVRSAIDAASVAVVALDTAVSAEPEDPSLRANLVASLIVLGELQREAGDAEAARSNLKRAQDVSSVALVEASDDEIMLRHRAAALSGLGDLDLTSGAADVALEKFLAVKVILERLARSNAGDRHRLRDVSVALDKTGLARSAVASARGARADLGSAAPRVVSDDASGSSLRDFTDALEIRRRLLRLDERDLQAAIDVAFSARRLSQFMAATDDVASKTRALTLAEESLRVARSAVNLSSDSVDAKREVALSQFQVGLAFATLDRAIDAGRAFGESARTWNELAALAPLSASQARLRDVALHYASQPPQAPKSDVPVPPAAH